MKNNKLDAIDIRILSAIQQHGQLSKAKLADIINLSETPCWTRFNRLKKAGLIQRYRADIDLGKITPLIQVIVNISLKHHKKSDFDRFESYITKVPEITECSATGGGSDYILKIYSSNFIQFQALIDSMLSAELGIDRYFTYFITREIKNEPLNLEKLKIPQK